MKPIQSTPEDMAHRYTVTNTVPWSDSSGEVDGGPGDHWTWRECRACGKIEPGGSSPSAGLRYFVKEYARGHWHVIGPSGLPIYDDAPHGKDKPIIFRDVYQALACAKRCNIDDDGKTL